MYLLHELYIKSFCQMFLWHKQGLFLSMPCYAEHLILLPFSNNVWLHSEYFVTPNSSRHWKLFFGDFTRVFSMSDACFNVIVWPFCNIVSNVKLKGFVKLVASVIYFFLFVLFCFLKISKLSVFVPVLKPLLHCGKCIQCCHGLIRFYICCCFCFGFFCPPPPLKNTFF